MNNRFTVVGSRATRLAKFLIPVAAGAVVALGQAPFGLFWLAIPALAFVLAAGGQLESRRAAGWFGWRVGLGVGLVTFVWIVEPFLVNAARDGWLAPFALFAMSSGMGLFWALGFWMARHVGAAGRIATVLAIPAYLALAEVLRSYVFSGFPWALTAYLWIDTPVYQAAAFLGPHGLTLATLMLSGALGYGAVHRRFMPVAVCGLVFVGAYGLGLWQLGRPIPEHPTEPRIARLIQPNASQKQKWDPAFMPLFFERQLELTAAPGDAPVDLVIWPEVAVPFLLNDKSAPFERISTAAKGAPVVLGAQRLEQAGGELRAFNSLAVISPAGQVTQIYDKHHLVPFGEYIPGRRFFDRVGVSALTAKYGTGYTAGPDPELIDFGKLGHALPLICYEAIFPHEIRRVGARPDWLLMITNDAWFGEAVGPYQHFAQARARAIEFGLPMLRVANTGISAVIDGRGQVGVQLPLGVAGKLDVRLPASMPETLYWKYGDTPSILMMIVLALLAIVLSRKNRIDPELVRM